MSFFQKFHGFGKIKQKKETKIVKIVSCSFDKNYYNGN